MRWFVCLFVGLRNARSTTHRTSLLLLLPNHTNTQTQTHRKKERNGGKHAERSKDGAQERHRKSTWANARTEKPGPKRKLTQRIMTAINRASCRGLATTDPKPAEEEREKENRGHQQDVRTTNSSAPARQQPGTTESTVAALSPSLPPTHDINRPLCCPCRECSHSSKAEVVADKECVTIASRRCKNPATQRTNTKPPIRARLFSSVSSNQPHTKTRSLSKHVIPQQAPNTRTSREEGKKDREPGRDTAARNNTVQEKQKAIARASH